MWIKEEGWIEEEKGIMDIDRGFPLLEILRFRMYSLESSESLGWFRDWYPDV